MPEEKEVIFDLEEMIRAGLHLGHNKSKLHPKMKQYIFGIRKTVHIINLEETVVKFKEALAFIEELMSQNKTILFVGTKIQHQEPVEEFAQKHNFPYVKERWLGGLLTNFSVMRQRVKYMQDLREKIESEDFDKYPKKEQSKMKKEFHNLYRKFGGVESLEQIPDALFVCDIKKDKIAVKEASEKGVPVIAIVDTNADPSAVDYPIPASDDALASIEYILDKVGRTIKQEQS